MSIRQLPEDAVAKLKSSTVILSLNGVAAGLVGNALDAGASKVNITVDYPRGNCTVEDNGSGIPPGDFKKSGGLCKPHYTSRYPPDDSLHGRHGNFLASLATFSLLRISSHSQSHIPHSSILIHNTTVLSRHIPAPPEQRLRTFCHGTRVVVHDLFGSMPVRVKQRPDALTDRASIEKEWMQLVHDCAALLLSWPHPVSILLREATEDREVRLKSAEDADAMARPSSLLLRASLVDSDHVKSLAPVSASDGRIHITGCISTKPMASNRAQFISIGVRPVPNGYGTNMLYEEVNRVFLNSRYSAMEDGFDPSVDVVSGREKSSRRRVERWPIFHLQIKGCDKADSDDLIDLLDDRGSLLSTVLDLLKVVCYAFLEKHHLVPKKASLSTKSSRASTPSSLKTSTSNVRSISRSSHRAVMEMRPSRPSPFDGWQRTKVGHEYPSARGVDRKRAMSIDTHHVTSQSTTKRRLVGEGGKLLCKPFEDAGDVRDPLSGSMIQESGHFHGSCTQQSSKTVDASQNLEAKLQSQPRQRESREAPFEDPPLPIPRLYDEHRPPLDEIGAGVRSKFFDNSAKDCGVRFESGSTSLTSRITKSNLAKAKVIGQVDRKFILAKMALIDDDSTAREGLVMLDQHAVDERCKLEDLMLGYFEADDTGAIRAKVELVDKHLVFEFADQDLELLEQHQTYLAAWGVTYEVQRVQKRIQRGECDGTGHVRVTGLPPSIVERCSTEPRLLAHLLRREVWDFSDSGRLTGAPSLPFVEEAVWVSNFHRCPKGILELLHSRSCRSAIMFNDVLTIEDCSTLLERLACCSFPFHCAHGRPTMAPLLGMGNGSTVGSWQECRTSPWERWLGQ